MAVSVYTPPANRIIHRTGVDFGSLRPSSFQPVHLVQYDQRLPIVAVSLYKDGEIYTIPNEVRASNVLVEKRDGTFVSNPVLGCNTERNVLYFEATYQMLYFEGVIKPILEIIIADDDYAGSSAITMIVDRNPVQESAKESSNEYKSVWQFMMDARRSRDEAKKSEINAKDSETRAAVSAKNAKASEDAAYKSEQNSKNSEEAALDAKNSALDSKAAAAESEKNAASSAKDSDYYSKLSESHSHGNTGVREGENVDNSKYWSEQSQYFKDSAEETAGNLQSSLDEINKKLGMTEFDIDDDGNLIYTDDGGYIFTVEDDGYLYWEVA